MSGRQRNPHNYLGRCSFGTAFSLSYVSRYVRTTHYLAYNHPIGRFVPYVRNSYFPASLRSLWKCCTSHMTGNLMSFEESAELQLMMLPLGT